MDVKIFRINYKSDFILTLNSDAGWMTPFCIKFWTGAPSQAYFVGWDGETYTHCAYDPTEPTKLLVQFDDHHLPIGDLKFQIAYHFTVADFPNDTEDEVLNQAKITTEVDGVAYDAVMLDFNGETAPEIQFSLPAYANEAQRIANEQARIEAEQQRIADEEARIQAEETRQQNEQQRIQHEEYRVSEFARLKSESEAATTAANAAATLANEKAQLAADKAALAQAAATLANEKAQLAADKAALAAAAAALANDKAALAQQKAAYAQAQGDYAKTQGDYAKAQGDTAQADHERAEADHTTAAADHQTAAADHTTAASDHSRAEADHTTASSDHTRAESDHATASSDHTRAESDHTTAASDHTRAESDHTTAATDHTTAQADHTRAESDHAAVEMYVDSLGVFDLSKHNAVGGVLATYADLDAALNALNALDSQYKYGGMSLKFVQTSDNTYVQFRYMSSSTAAADFINVNNWQGVDEDIKAGSKNLAESGAVSNAIQQSAIVEDTIDVTGDRQYRQDGYFVSSQQVVGQQVSLTQVSTQSVSAQKYDIHPGTQVKVEFKDGSGAYGFALCDENDNVLEYCTNTGKESYVFATRNTPTHLWVSEYKTSKIYTIFSIGANTESKINKDNINKIESFAVEMSNDIYDYSSGESLQVRQTYNDVVLFARSGGFMSNTGSSVKEFDVSELLDVKITASAFTLNKIAAAAFYRENGAFIESFFAGSSETLVTAYLSVPAGAAILRLSARPGVTPTASKIVKTLKEIDAYTKEEIDEKTTISDEETVQITTSVKGVGYIPSSQNVGDTISFNTASGMGVIMQNLSIPAGSVVTVLFSESTGAYGFALCDDTDKIIEICSNQNKSSYTFAKTSVQTRFYASSKKFASASRYTVYVQTLKEGVIELQDKIYPSEGFWREKKIWWCGTSIPAGSDATFPGAGETIAGNYPTEVGNDLGAVVINKSVGGSMCRANVRTGDYVGAEFANITSALSMTKEEIENFIDNYDSIKEVLLNAPSSLSDSYKERLRTASFEDRLLPYLDGTYDMPDLFVFDHGHNDFKYKLSNNSTDIELEPTVANIGGELTEDTFMTANNNEKLESFFGSLSNIPSGKKNGFIASVNRNCFIGAENFLITLILHYNPHARIVFISNYEYENGVAKQYAPLIDAQNNIANSWAFPICNMYEYLGFSNHLIPGSMAWFNTQYPAVTPATTDVTVYRAYLPDTVHPHSDITGDSNNIYAGIISEFIRRIR